MFFQSSSSSPTLQADTSALLYNFMLSLQEIPTVQCPSSSESLSHSGRWESQPMKLQQISLDFVDDINEQGYIQRRSGWTLNVQQF